MMRVFIADDEEIIRDGIRNCIEKEQERFLFAGEAPDGEMALPMLMEMKPDVLITDIRMPFMDGLELAKVVRRTMPWLRIVFLSGHDEFEYAQKAVSLHADAYLLKPVSSAQLLETLGQVAEQIEQEQQQLRSAGANSRSEREEDVLREHFLNDLLSGSVPTAEAAVQGERWGLLLTAKQYLVCIVRLPESYRTAKDTLLQASACAEDGVFGSTDFAGVQHEFDFSAGGSLADKLRHAAPEDVPRIVEGYFGDSAAQDMQSVLYRYYLLMNLLVTASQLADEVQAGSIPPPEDPQAVFSQAATLEGTKACAAEVLGRMTRLCYRHQNVRYSAEISRAKEFIRENYADSGISLHMVAAEVGFSPNHFSTVFSQETGQTFVEYLTAVRIEAAKHLLTEGNSRMSDIAFDVGYQDSHYFSYLFKKHVGVSPREYRSRSEER